MLGWAVFAPLIGFLAAGLFGSRLGNRFSQTITCSLMLVSTLMSWYIAYSVISTGVPVDYTLLQWLDVGNISASWALSFNSLSATMLVIVSTVSFCVHVYSIGYMERDLSISRFMAYLSLFTFMMMMLVSADNLIQLFFGWEGVGLTSYLLIGFWYSKDSANAAAMKAFLVNRVGDLGLVLGLGVTYGLFQSFNFSDILIQASGFSGQTFSLLGFEVPVLELMAMLLFIGAMGKSAQLGLHTWLPDAMEGPTPVSALIHAATMVTAGVFLVVRMSPLFELAPFTRDVVMFIGASTAFFAGTIAMTQFDIKRVIAYSTCSQLGYMFFAAGASAYSAAMFHLGTHAFFKALLFLGSGSVIHAMSDEQDMRKMGGIWKLIPRTYAMMWIGSLALAGMPLFAGYYSKDLILSATWLADGWVGKYALILGLAAAFMTAFYSWRLLWMTFHGTPRADDQVMAHIHESPTSMMLPLVILAVGAIFGGYIPEVYGWFTHHSTAYWNGVVATPIPHEAFELVPGWVAVMAKALGVTGIALGILFYSRLSSVPDFFVRSFKGVHNFFYNKWYFDELYDRVFVQRSLSWGDLFWTKGDQKGIDGYGPDGVTSLSYRVASRVSQIQTGYIYQYAFVMAGGIALFCLWYLLARGG